jgi:release factor glutamine methyltransferase
MIKAILSQAITALRPVSLSAEIDAEILLASALHKNRAFLHAYPEYCLKDEEYTIYQDLIAKRSLGQPIAYLLGRREFWSLSLQVNEHTLIPRPETELLVELTLSLLQGQMSASILDLGTGSGAIALALATEKPNWNLLACDIHPATLAVAEKNRETLKLDNVEMICSDWFRDLPLRSFDAIVSNPPYIAANDPHINQGDLRFEPKKALVSGEQGLYDLASIIEQSHERLNPGGLLLVEHGFSQKEAVIALFKAHGYENINSWQDWQGHDRVCGGRRKSN